MVPDKEKKLFQIIEDQKRELVNKLTTIPPDKLVASPGKGKWSVVQILKHLITSEKLSLLYLRKKWSYNPDLKKSNLITEIRFLPLRYANWTPVKLKAPKMVNIESVHESFEELLAQWNINRIEMYAFMETLPEDVYSRNLYKHPIAGKLAIKHMLLFFKDHIARHIRQINQIIK